MIPSPAGSVNLVFPRREDYTRPMAADDLDALLALTLAGGFGPTLTARCLTAMGSAQAVVGASASRLAGVDGIGSKRAADLRRTLDEVFETGAVAAEKALIAEHGAALLTLDDDDYPALLRHISDPPPLLYVRGELLREDAVALAIVGARKCTAYGREQADRLASQCAQAGLSIVSGGAYGIDAAAHHAAVRVRGRTIVVLGSGLADAYPKQNRPLFDQIVNEGLGAVVSELPMRTPPQRENFPRRNRIVSGLALGVLVVEASSRSGALITARLAAEDHGREVMAVPGRVDSLASQGCHKIIREGWATLVTNAADVLDALGETGELLKAGVTVDRDGGEVDGAASPSLFEQNLTDSQRKIVAALDEALALDQLAAATGLAVHVVQADITMLQIRGVIAREGSRFRRKR